MRKQQKLFQTIGIIVLALSLIIMPITGVKVDADYLQDLMAERDQIDQAMQDTRNLIDSLENQLWDSQTNLAWLQQRSAEQQEQFLRLTEEKEGILLMKKTLLVNLDIAKQRLEDKRRQYGDRIESMFAMQDKSLFELLLESESLQGFFTTVKMMRFITESDEEALDELKQEEEAYQERVKMANAQLSSMNEKLDAVDQELAQLQEDQNYYSSLVNEYTAAVDDAHGELSYYGSRQGELDQAITDEEARLEAERLRREEEERLRREEEERQRLAEEERRRQEEEQRQQQQQQPQPQPEPTNPPAQNTGGALIWPVPGHYWVTSPFGYRSFDLVGINNFHGGMDIGAPMGVPIVAADGGTVVQLGYYGTYGNMVRIDHGNGMETVYAHMSGFNVAYGAYVAPGQTVGFCGSTGRSSGPHLHFEVRIGGVKVDPALYLY